MIRDLDDKGLGQNKVLCSSSRVKLLMVNYHAGSLALPAPGKQISGYPRTSGSKTILTRIPLYYLFLVAFSLLPLPCGLFFVTVLGALLSASCRSPSFSLQRFNRLDCWFSHWWYGINSRRSRRRLVRMVLVERADELSKVLDCGERFPDVLFFWVTFPCHQIL